MKFEFKNKQFHGDRLTQKTPKHHSYTLKTLSNSSIQIPDNTSQNKYYQITNTDGFIIRIYFMTHSIIRIRMAFDTKSNFSQQSYSLITTAWNDRFDQLYKNTRKKITPLTNVPFQYKQNDGNGSYYYFQTWQLRGKIYDNPYGIQISNKNGNIIHRDLRGRTYKQDPQGRVYHYSIIDPENDCFYGFGQNTGKLNKLGCRIRLTPQDALGYDPELTSALYKHIPFYVKVNKKSKHAIGFFYHNTYQSVFDMGSEKNGYWQPYSYFCADGGDIDLFIINGPTIKKVVQKYSDLTGKTAFAPLQSLGYLASSMYYAQLEERCDLAIIDFIKKCKKQNVPVSNFHLSSGYTTNQNKQTPQRHIFHWNNQKFPNPIQFFQSMQQLGVTISPNIKPGVLTTNPLYQQFAQSGSFIKDPQNPLIPYIDRWWGGDGSFIDFTNPQARTLWKDMLKDYIISKGSTSIWNDNNQYSSIDNRSAKCTYDYQQYYKNQIPYGIVDELKTIQPLLMAHTTQQVLKQQYPSNRTFIITRAASPGMQRYASSWSGDNTTSWSSLKSNIATLLNMGISGFANYGCDIGGFWGKAPQPQLFLRWVQHGIFQPRFSIHSCNSDNTVTQPWMFPQIADLISKSIRFRYMLLPYLYSLLYYSHIRSRLITRALAYQFQDSDFQNCADQTDQFMLGPYLLVANVLDPMSKLQQNHQGNTYINKTTLKNKNQQTNRYDCTGFPNINCFVPNCVELNQPNQNTYFSFSKNDQPTKRPNPTNSPLNTQPTYTTVYLPAGCNWYSWNGRDRYQGGQTIQIKINLQSIPLFLRDKSIIPLAYKFGKYQQFDIIDMNKQLISGLYLKIIFDHQTTKLKKISYSVKQKNFVQFVMYQDDGITIMDKYGKNKQKQKQKDKDKDKDKDLLQVPFGQLSKIFQSKLNQQIPDDASFLLTKINVRHPLKKPIEKIKKQQNTNILRITITRHGNLSNDNISMVNALILEIKSIDKSPIWISLNSNKCKQVRDQIQWMNWKQQNTQKYQYQMEKSLLADQYGCWYYDHEKGATILKINKYIVKPTSQDKIKKYRNFQICVCKDPLIQFSNQYIQTQEENMEDRIQSAISQEQLSTSQYKYNDDDQLDFSYWRD